MGLNIDTLFVQGDPKRIAEGLSSLTDDPKWKIAISEVGGGWTQVIDSHATTPPALAARLSATLEARVVCAQVYEVSGDASVHVFERGDPVESWADDASEDPWHEVQRILGRMGIVAPLLQFRETVRRVGWELISKK